MPVSFPCPQCRAVIKAPKPLPAGQKVKCPKCMRVFAVPGVQKTSQSSQGIQRTSPSNQGLAPRPAAAAPLAFGYDDPIGPTGDAPGPRRKKSSSAAMLNLSILMVVVLIAGGGIAAAVFWGSTRPVVASRDKTSGETDPASTGNEGDTGRVLDTSRTGPMPTDPGPKPVEYVNKGTGQEDPLAYVLPESTAIGGANLGVLAKAQPKLAGAIEKGWRDDSWNKLLLDPKKDAGIDYTDLFDRVFVAVQADVSKLDPGKPSRPEYQTLIIKSKTPFDQRRMAMALGAGAPRRVKEKSIFEVKDANFTVAFMPNDQILILTNLDGPALDTLVASAGAAPVLPPETLKLVRKAEQGAFWMVLPFDATIRGAIKEKIVPELAQLPPELQPAAKAAVPDAKALAVWLGFDAMNIKLSVGLQCANEALAKQLATASQTYWLKQKPSLHQQLALALAAVKVPKDVGTLVRGVIDSSQVVAPGGPMVEASIQLSVPALEGFAQEATGKDGLAVLASLDQFKTKFMEKPFAVDAMEKQLLDQINALRKKDDLPELKVNPKLFAMARKHAEAMAKQAFADDTIDEKNTKDRLKAIDFKFGEAEFNLHELPVNVPLIQAFQIWQGNQAAKANLLGKEFTETGIGYAKDKANKTHVYQVFVSPPKDKDKDKDKDK